MDQTTVRRVERQRAYYQNQAATFDRGHWGSRLNRCHFEKIKRIHRHLGLAPQQRVLEVGTGTGVHAGWLLERCAVRYVGVDVSPAMLEVAKDRLGEGVELVEAAAENLPFDDASFDAAYCSGTLHHVADKALAISEMRRVVKVGGRIVISEPNPWNPLNAWSWTTNPNERGQLEMRPAKLIGWCERTGLDVDHVEFFNFTPPFPQLLSRSYDVIDAVASRLPIVRRIASMLLLAATATSVELRQASELPQRVSP